MTIKTFELSTVDGRRFVKPSDRWLNLRVDHNSTVTLISELGDPQASVDVPFTANYHASEAVVGLIQLQANLLWEKLGPHEGLVLKPADVPRFCCAGDSHGDHDGLYPGGRHPVPRVGPPPSIPSRK